MDAILGRRGVLSAFCGLGLSLGSSGAARGQPAGRSRSDLFVILYRPGPAWKRGEPMQNQDLRDHARYMQALTDQGVLLAAGPLEGLDGGMVVLRADSEAAAAAVMNADPAVTAGVFKGEVSRWRPAFDPGARFQMTP